MREGEEAAPFFYLGAMVKVRQGLWTSKARLTVKYGQSSGSITSPTSQPPSRTSRKDRDLQRKEDRNAPSRTLKQRASLVIARDRKRSTPIEDGLATSVSVGR